MLPLPKLTAELIDQARDGYHAGLRLDKHIEPPTDAQGQKLILQQVCSARSDRALLDSLAARNRTQLANPHLVSWMAVSQGPLTLHLSRATALENAGIALHPLYGFAYLPGSGLKGLARAWAERVWLEAQPDKEAALRNIREVFGYAPRSEEGKSWVPESVARDRSSSTGCAIFHDAWPHGWPRLIVDVVGVHHPKYYQAEQEHKVPPPGDWEDPVPTTFLAVAPGTEFVFAIAPRRAEHQELARLAAEWLQSALADWGAGAKTAAGYGRIVGDKRPDRIEIPGRPRFDCTLELTTPAFLAGALQKIEDCDLRGATLRGQLRWWWRTLHAKHLEPRSLRRLETAIWGAASEGSAVQLSIEPSGARGPTQFSAREALGYLAYGMGMREAGRRLKPAGSRWRLTLSARGAQFREDPGSKSPAKLIPPAAVLQQALAALWLLTRYGGVGAKGRKGFGSLVDLTIDGINTMHDCISLAKSLRISIGLSAGKGDPRVPCVERMQAPNPIRLREANSDRALAKIAAAYREFVRSRTLRDRLPLGLPRSTLTADLGAPVGDVSRHPTTIHFHLSNSADGLILRMACFEIDRIVHGSGFFVEIEQALQRSLARDTGGAGDQSQHPGEKVWQSARLTYNALNRTLTATGPGNVQANALAPHGEQLLSTLPQAVQQKVRTNRFVLVVARVRGSELIAIEPKS